MRALIINCSPVQNGATAEIVNILKQQLSERMKVKDVCIDDYKFSFCKGCRTCHSTAKCVQTDDVEKLITEFENANIVICVSPSYWADVPGQFKAFIDRCTPWSNTHEPHAMLSDGKKGYIVSLRTGPNIEECKKIIHTIEHFYGHLEIECCDTFGMTSIESKDDILNRESELIEFCIKIR